MYVNKVFLYGNLGRDPEVRALPSGAKVASFSMATTRTYKDKEVNKKDQTDWHNIVIFGRSAEIAEQYLKKGKPIFVDGRLQTRSWDDKDGKKQYRTEVVVDNFQFGPNVAPAAGGTAAPNGGQGDAKADPNPASASSDASGSGIEYPQEDINPDDIPF